MLFSRSILTVLAFIIFLAVPGASASTWTNTGTGTWSNAANWNGGVPINVFYSWTQGTDGVISNGGTAQVTGSSAARGALVGYGGTGTLQILAGASLTTYQGAVGNGPVYTTPVGTGTVDVWGAWLNNFFIQAGQGTINIHSGGRIQGGEINLGVDEGYTGTLNVNGTIHPFTFSTVYLNIGVNGNGELKLENGGSISGSRVRVGSAASSTGTAQVNGGTWQANVLEIGYSGQGTVNLVGGKLTVGDGTGRIDLGITSGSHGVLNLGTGTTVGLLEAGEIRGLLGSAELRLNHNLALGYALNKLLTGSLTLRQIAGTTTVSGANTHTGGAIVEGGTLILSDAGDGLSALGTGALEVKAGGTFQGVGEILGDALVSGHLRPGNSPGTLEFAQDLTLEQTAVTQMELSSLTLHDKIIVGGTLTYDGLLNIDLLGGFIPAEGAQFDLFQAADYTAGSRFDGIVLNRSGLFGFMDYSSGILTISSVPEPSVPILALSALLVLRRRSPRRRR